MTQSNYRWSLARFWRTLNYFEVIPGVSFWQNIIKPKSQHHTINHSIMKNILLVNSYTNLSQKVIQHLVAKNYGIKLLNLEDYIRESGISPGILASYTLNSYSQEKLKSEIIKDIESIIYFAKNSEFSGQNTVNYNHDLAELLKFAAEYFNSSREKSIFDFTNYDLSIKELWGAVDDVVMGGVSESQIQLINNRAVFLGNVSTKNNGGFASVRTRNFYPVMNLGDYEGIELKVKGDGKRYKFITRCEGTWDGIGYCYSFDTVKDDYQIIRIRFADLIPVFRAKTVADADSFNSNQVYSMQLMLSKFEYDGKLNPYFEPGIFRLEVEYIKAYGNTTSKPQFILVSSSDVQDVSSEILNDKLRQENMVRNSGLNYTIIRSYNLSESIADKVLYVQEKNYVTDGIKENKLAEICLESLESSSAVNKIFEISNYNQK
ncbi:MAG: CIA30 family protein [Xenococcaceae cyanobacterium MO_234.B1]|nr:CIA30 family protein [Xenococcaceae cyanobacterium MO_234.B1]